MGTRHQIYLIAGVGDSDPRRQDNNSGFTVIDVTDPISPAYCFCGWDEDYGFTAGAPIDPEDYALRYYVEPEDEWQFEDLDQEVQDAIRALQDQDFIDSESILDEAWRNSVAELMGHEKNEEPPSPPAREFIKDLRVVVKGPGRAWEWLHRWDLPEHCNPVIVEYFLISQDLSGGKELDLSWMRLSPAQILQVVQAVLQHDSYQITSLDISGNSEITVENLSEIFKLPKASEITRLFLFGCPKVEDINRKDLASRIGAGAGTEVFNSHLSYQD
ncbi:hypothetical protein FS837_000270 [Tulasnella sp. UAMH 9824]|nr:hypothetical protein FS837_000270 [Tulasnella sp. UAMH 9824]